MIELADRIELHELPGRYGDAIDDRNWDGLDAIFTADATFDLTDLAFDCSLVYPKSNDSWTSKRSTLAPT